MTSVAPVLRRVNVSTIGNHGIIDFKNQGRLSARKQAQEGILTCLRYMPVRGVAGILI